VPASRCAFFQDLANRAESLLHQSQGPRACPSTKPQACRELRSGEDHHGTLSSEYDLWLTQTLPGCFRCVSHIGEYIGLAIGSDSVANMSWADLRHFTTTPQGYRGYAMNVDYAREEMNALQRRRGLGDGDRRASLARHGNA
jgi:hypothetical protein